MKKISLLLIVSLCLLGGCKDDLLKEGGENGLTTEGTNYLSFNIVSDGGGAATRAWPGIADDNDFHAGDRAEQDITTTQGSNVAILFNENDSFHSMCELTGDVDIKDVTPGDRYGNGLPDGTNLEKTIGKFTANVRIAEGESLPTKVLVVLNGNPERLTALENTFKNREGLTLPDGSAAANDAEYVLAYLTRRLSDKVINRDNSSVVIFSPSGVDTEYCTMTNSVYLGTGNKDEDIKLTANYGTGTIYDLVDIRDNIQATKEAAESDPVTVHVERLAVKVEVDISKDMKQTPLGEESTVAGDGLKFPLLLRPTGDGATTQVQQATGTTVAGATKSGWAFAMLGWSTNAVARRMYLFKNLNDRRGDISKASDDLKHYSESGHSISTEFFQYWNDAPHARCYWAVDGHYADPDVYPVQYRVAMDTKPHNSFVEIQDRNKVPGSGDDDEADGTQNMPLYYYSYTQMRMISMGLNPSAADNLDKIKEGALEDYLQHGNLRKNLKYRYCGENVLGQKLIDDPNHVWRGAATHVVFFGQLLLGNEITAYEEKAKNEGYKSTQDLLESVPDKLYAAGCYWNRANYMQYAYSQIFNSLTSTSRTITDYFGDGEDPDGKVVTFTTPRNNITLYYQKADGTGEETPLLSTYFTDLISAPDNGVTEESLNAVHDKFNYKEEDSNGDDNDGLTNCIFRLSAANVSNGDGRVMLGLKKDYKLIIKGENERGEKMTVDITPGKFLSIAYEFANVADYYALGRMYYYAPIWHHVTAIPETPANVGDIGVVRNHWYKLTVSSLLQPGIPVTDPGQPIIPNIDPTDKYLGLDIHILPWHVINQTVTLQ